MTTNGDHLTASGQIRALGLRLAAAGGRISMAELIGGLGQTGLGMTLLILALPALIPIPGPVGVVLGFLIAFVALQIISGARRLWLPPFIRARTIPADIVAKAAAKAMPMLTWAERWLKPRRLLPLTGRVGRMALGIPLLVMAITLALPVPMGNVLPVASITAFALGLMLRDGMAVLAGLVLAVAAVLWMAVLILFGAELWILVTQWIGWR